MCIAYPGQVVAIEAGTAVVETQRRRRRATLLLAPEVRVGDWVVVSAGAVIRTIAADEAHEINAMLDEAARAEAVPQGAEPPDVAAPAGGAPSGEVPG